MWGWFIFKRDINDENSDTFELEIEPYKLDWNSCQWI